MSDNLTYETRWDLSAATPEQALAAVDGSASEDVLADTGQNAARLISKVLQLQPQDRVFELGCGVGRIGKELASICAEWHGADISGNMIKVAAQRTAQLDNVFLYKLDRTELKDLADERFDKAYCVAVFIHMDKEDVFLYLKELARVLKPGGVLYFDTWNIAHPVGWKRWMMEVDNWAASDQRQRKDVSRNQFCLMEELRLFLQHAGLTEVAAFSDSPWNQVVAAKTTEPEQITRLRQYIDNNLNEIRYSQRWTELFDLVLEVFSGRLSHKAAIEHLAYETDEESVMFRDYLKAQMDRHIQGAVTSNKT